MREDLVRIVEVLRGRRQYASFFEWLDKEQKEYGVAEELLASLNSFQDLGLRELSIHRPDPPDLTCRDGSGDLIGIEVAEVVCESAVRESAQGRSTVRNWGPGELASAIDGLLKRKDRKKFRGGPFDKKWLCLFTDEPMLTVASAQRQLSGTTFGSLNQISQAFLLFSYDPSIQGYPVIELQLHA